MSRTQGQAIFHLVAMIGFVGVGAAGRYRTTDTRTSLTICAKAARMTRSASPDRSRPLLPPITGNATVRTPS